LKKITICSSAPRLAATAVGLALGLSMSAALHAVPEAVVVIVSAQSGVTELSKNQIADIFLGKITRFPNEEQVMPVDLPEGAPAREDFYAKFTGKSPAQLKAHWSRIIFTGRGQPPIEVASSAAAKKFIAENPRAIGYIEQSLVDPSVRVLAAP
jgi:ABC-type phosphate transport system substrate-binding protein